MHGRQWRSMCPHHDSSEPSHCFEIGDAVSSNVSWNQWWCQDKWRLLPQCSVFGIFFQPPEAAQGNSSRFSRTVLLLTMPVRLSRCWAMKLRTSYHHCSGLQTALISTWSGSSCRSASTARESRTLTTLLSDSWRSSPDVTTRSSVLQLLSGELVCVHVWRQMEDTLNTFYDNW